MFEQRPLFTLTIMAWSLLSCLWIIPNFISGDLELRTSFFGVAVTAIFSVAISALYFYRRYYVWFGAGFASVFFVAVWRQEQTDEPHNKLEALSNSMLPYGIVALIVLLLIAKAAQVFFGANLVFDDTDIVKQGLHPTRQDWILTGLFLVVATVLAAFLRSLA